MFCISVVLSCDYTWRVWDKKSGYTKHWFLALIDTTSSLYIWSSYFTFLTLLWSLQFVFRFLTTSQPLLNTNFKETYDLTCIFQNKSEDISIFLQSTMLLTYRWREIVLAISRLGFGIFYSKDPRPVTFCRFKGWQFTFQEHLHDHTILPRRNGWAHLACYTPPLFIKVPIPGQKSERTCIWLLMVSILPQFLQCFYYHIGTVWYFCHFIDT